MAERGEVMINSQQTTPDAVVEKINDLGYECTLIDKVEDGKVELLVGKLIDMCLQ